MNEMEKRADDIRPYEGNDVEAMTPAQLGGEIRLLTSQARRMALSYGIQIGYRLRVAHEKVGPHGWAEWLKQETDFSPAAASRFEKLYEGYGADQGSLFGVGNKFPTLEKISVSNALRLLAVPEEEREEVAAEVDAEHLSTRELEKALAERDEARKALQDTSARLEQAEKTLAGARNHETELSRKLAAARDDLQAADIEYAESERQLKDRIRELEARPVEVAVERDEEAIRKAAADARQAAEAAARTEMDKLRERLERAEKARKKAEDAAKKAEEETGPELEKAKAEVLRAEKEAADLRRKLASAESGAGEVAMLARMAQSNFAAAMDKIGAMQSAHPETAEKMLAGMERIVAVLGEQIKAVRG